MSKIQSLFDVEVYSVAEESKASRRRRTRTQKLSSVDPQVIIQVFEYWVETCKEGRGPKPLLSEDRKLLIASAIHDYGVQTCKDAIYGCSQSGWHMGQNPSGKKYNSLELIFRNEEKIERFAEIGWNARTKGGFIDE